MDDGRPLKTAEVLPLSSPWSPQTLIISAFLVAFLLLIGTIYLNRRRSSSKGNSLLLVGPSDGGKTAILSQLAYSKTLQTQTSMQTNVAVMTLSKKSIRVIDVPGQPRLRDQFQDYLSDTKAVGFVVDTNSVSRNAPAVAEHLHHLLHALTSLPLSQSQPSLLILAHKSDLIKTGSSAHTNAATLATTRVKTILERELEKRRLSQIGGIHVEGLGEEGERSDMGGLECGEKEGSAFKFDDWEGGEVVFLGTSAVSNGSQLDEKPTGENGLGPLQEWLENNL